MKKLLTTLLLLVFLLTGCNGGSSKETSEASRRERATRETTTQATTQPTEAPTIPTTVAETTVPTEVSEVAAGEETTAARQNNSTELKGLSAEETIDFYFYAMKTLDPDAVSQFSGSESDDITSELEDMMGFDPHLIFGSLEYSIISIEESGDTASIKMTITNKDLSAAMTSYMTTLMEKATELTTNGSEEDMNALMESVLQIFADEIEKAELITKEIEFEMSRLNDIWVIPADNDAFMDAITGGMMTALVNLDF